MIKTALKQSRGFTLIELLAVIAILGILAGLVLVATSRVRSQARDTQRKAIVRSISEAQESYYNDNGKYATSWADLSPYLSSDPATGKIGPCNVRGTDIGAYAWRQGSSYHNASITDYTVQTYYESKRGKRFICSTGGSCQEM
ncbi:type II secretion system protein [bacterium]|nr:type II secretion system protein [bacterium]